MARTKETRHKEWHETIRINVSVNLGLIFVINNVGIKINADVNGNN